MMKYGFKWGGAALLSMLLLCSSCGDADLFDTDKWSDKIEGWEPGVSLKVIHGSFTLWDLINQGDDDVIVKEGNNLIIQYTEKDIYHIGIDEVFDMPEQNIVFSTTYTILDEPIGLEGGLQRDVDIELSLMEPITIPNNCVLQKIGVSTYFVLPALGFEYKVRDISINTTELLKDKVIPANGSIVKLEDLNFVLNGNNEIDLKVYITVPQGTELSSSELNLEFGLKDLQFKKAEGKIAVDPITIDRSSFNMEVDFLDEIGGKFKFAEPQLNIILRNKGIGVPLSVNATFEGQSSEGEKATLKLNAGDTLMTPGNKLNQVIPDTLGLNADNSNIVNFLSLPPSGDIYYEGTVTVNPKEYDDNVIYSDAEIGLDAYIRIPFTLSAEGLNYKDTLNDIDIDQKYADKIKEGVITITAVNGLPLNLQIPALVLMGENGERLESLSAVKGHDIIKAANGNEKSVLEFKLTEEQAKKLGQTDNILLEVNAYTTNNQVVTVAADAKLSFDLKIVAKAVITNLDDF